ncbi:glycosyltransferase [Acinetobacter radioresistens]|uniref:glycosyltransferase n=1 Tax=Acinetobacter radioresistens TaxID=40216 RepID=UPI00224779C6|nr:glycosyltransferase [Acinetobacter radioresistens]MCX0339647.1 glycosyltransferase [Acinetobacter radioresistens]
MKDIAVCLEHRFYEYEGNLYTKLAFPYNYWKDYLTFFNRVTVIARAKSIEHLDENMVLVTGPNVDYEPLPYYIGLKQFIFKILPLIYVIFKISFKYKYFLLRTGNSTNILAFFLIILRKPYLREYPGNIEEGVIGFAGNSLKIRILAKFLHFLAKVQGKFSKANSFVSEYCKTLYASDKPSYIFSSFKESEINKNKQDYNVIGNFKIICVGRLEGEKGHINLLKAVSQLDDVSKYEIHIIGDGSQKNKLEIFARDNNLSVIFYGSITNRDQLFSLLAKSDVFVIPSLTEGMPRALLEAMAVGLPCIGSKVGGIPEVLPNRMLYEATDLHRLKRLLEKAFVSKEFRIQAASENSDVITKLYSDEVLQAKKHEFWSQVYE